MPGKAVTLYLDMDLYEAFIRLCTAQGRKVSHVVADLMRVALKEATGQGLESAPVDCEALERDHLKMAREVDELARRLKRRKVYEDLSALARQLGLRPDLSNLGEVAPQLLEEWNRNSKHIAEDMHIFITLLRRVRVKKGIEAKLTALRGGIVTTPPPKAEETSLPKGQLKTPAPSVKEEEGWKAGEDWEEDEEEFEYEEDEDEEEWEEEEEWVVEEEY